MPWLPPPALVPRKSVTFARAFISRFQRDGNFDGSWISRRSGKNKKFQMLKSHLIILRQSYFPTIFFDWATRTHIGLAPMLKYPQLTLRKHFAKIYFHVCDFVAKIKFMQMKLDYTSVLQPSISRTHFFWTYRDEQITPSPSPSHPLKDKHLIIIKYYIKYIIFLNKLYKYMKMNKK